MNIFDYLDYRAFLKDFYEEQKSCNNFFSYRYMGKRLNLDAGFLVRIIQGRFHLADSKISKVTALCKFNQKEADYFETLVRFSKARTEKETKLYFEKLLSMKQVCSSRMEEFQYEYYKKWYYSAVRALIDCSDFRGDYKDLASRPSPPISVKEVKKAVTLLESLDMIKKNAEGRYILSDAHITTGKEFHSLAVRNFQKDTINLAAESLDRHNKTERDITSLTLSLDREAMEDVRELAREFRRAVMKRIDEVPEPERVYQLNIQLFPMSENVKRKAK